MRSELAHDLANESNMPRKQRQISAEFPYHINARCINKEWFRIPMNEVWDIFCDYIYLTTICFNLKIHSFVLMTNHFHMIVSTPEANISQAMKYFMQQVSCEITRRSGRINQTWGGPFHSSLITNTHYYLHAYKYVYRNPIEAGLSDSAHTYPYSTLAGKVGNAQLFIPIIEDNTLFDSFDSTLMWINTNYQEDHKEQIRRALKRKVFKLPLCQTSRRKSELEKDLS